jgi:hypothetical protein
MATSVRRRKFITLLGGAIAAWPLTARAQQTERVRRIGVLMHLASGDPEGQDRLTAFVQGLKDHGWIDGQRFSIPICVPIFRGSRSYNCLPVGRQSASRNKGKVLISLQR